MPINNTILWFLSALEALKTPWNTVKMNTACWEKVNISTNLNPVVLQFWYTNPYTCVNISSWSLTSNLHYYCRIRIGITRQSFINLTSLNIRIILKWQPEFSQHKMLINSYFINFFFNNLRLLQALQHRLWLKKWNRARLQPLRCQHQFQNKCCANEHFSFYHGSPKESFPNNKKMK